MRSQDACHSALELSPILENESTDAQSSSRSSFYSAKEAFSGREEYLDFLERRTQATEEKHQAHVPLQTSTDQVTDSQMSSRLVCEAYIGVEDGMVAPNIPSLMLTLPTPELPKSPAFPPFGLPSGDPSGRLRVSATPVLGPHPGRYVPESGSRGLGIDTRDKNERRAEGTVGGKATATDEFGALYSVLGPRSLPGDSIPAMTETKSKLGFRCRIKGFCRGLRGRFLTPLRQHSNSKRKKPATSLAPV